MARRRRPAKPKTALSDDEQSDFEQPGLPIRASDSNSAEDDFASDDEPSANGGAVNGAGADDEGDEGDEGDEDDEEAGDLEEDE